MIIHIPIPSRYRRAQVLANSCRIVAVLLFFVTLVVANTLFAFAGAGDSGFFGDTIARVTGDKLDTALQYTLYSAGVLLFIIGPYMSLLLYTAANTMSSSARIERDVALIKRLVKTQVGERAVAVETSALEEIDASFLTVRPLRIAAVAILVIVACGALSFAASLFIPKEQEASAFVVDTDCEVGDVKDSDCDGIPNAEEAWVAETFAPVYVYDNDEHNIVIGSDDFVEFRDVIYFHQVSAVHCNTTEGVIEDAPANGVLLTIVASYPYDYVPLGISEEEELDVLDHLGDTERVQICLARTIEESDVVDPARPRFDADDSIAYRVVFVQINRHESFNTYWGDSLAWADDTHFYLHISEGKHASYISQKECAAHPRDITALAYREDCATLEDADTIIRPTLAGLNVGQVGYQLIQATSELPEPAGTMFELNEELWLDSKFCGGYPPEKLIEMGQKQVQGFVAGADQQTLAVLNTILPFVDLETGRVTEVCGSSLRSKWWIPSNTGSA